MKKNGGKFFSVRQDTAVGNISSIDALAVGVTFAFFEVNIFFTVIIIGLTIFCISIIGVKIGNVFGKKCKPRAEFIGGTVLVLLGLKILLEHLFEGMI
ncbi:MAG: manganese efflux pump MntP family protein [Treponema sp.]|nr:manganese efflux pump MntP family protein [Treponema sp.]